MMKFEDNISVMLYACFAKKPFTSVDIIENVVAYHPTTIRRSLRILVNDGYLQRIGNYYSATEYAKDIFNVMRNKEQ